MSGMREVPNLEDGGKDGVLISCFVPGWALAHVDPANPHNHPMSRYFFLPTLIGEETIVYGSNDW